MRRFADFGRSNLWRPTVVARTRGSQWQSALPTRAQRLRAALPALLRTHKQDLTAILSTIQGVSAEEYRAGLNLGVLLRDCLELLNDPQFSELFPSAQTETQPGSAQANTEALPL